MSIDHVRRAGSVAAQDPPQPRHAVGDVSLGTATGRLVVVTTGHLVGRVLLLDHTAGVVMGVPVVVTMPESLGA
jgi:hypothetical protein